MSSDLTRRTGSVLHALVTRRVTLVCDGIPYEFHGVPFKKLLNRALVHASFLARPERPWGWPTQLQVEPDGRCNLRCVVCPVTTGLGRATGPMEPSLFQKLIDELGDYLYLILLWDWGEPFLNPDIYEMIAYARRKGIQLVSSTNGHLLAREGHVDGLIGSGLDWLIVAVDGVTQETYELYRQGGDLAKVLEGVRLLAARKRALGSPTPRINLRMVVMKQNEHEIPRLRELAGSLGVDSVSLKTMNPYGSEGDLLPSNPRYQRFRYAPGTFTPLRRRTNPCLHLWHMPSVHWSGVVSMCTYDAQEQYILGDLNHEPFKRIWSGQAARRYRRQFHSDWEGIALCKNCSYAYEGGSCIDEIIASVEFLDPESKPQASEQREER